jgi:hypothetical protein
MISELVLLELKTTDLPVIALLLPSFNVTVIVEVEVPFAVREVLEALTVELAALTASAAKVMDAV